MKRNPKVHIAILGAKTVFILIFFYAGDQLYPDYTMPFPGDPDILELGLILVPLGFIVGFGSWYLSKFISIRIALSFFKLHRSLISRFGGDSKKSDINEYFLGNNEEHLQNDRIIQTSFIGFAVTTFIVVSISGFLDYFNLSELLREISTDDKFLFYYIALAIGFSSPLMAVLILPIHLLETSNLSLLIKGKDGVKTVASPFKVVYGIGTLITAGTLLYLAYTFFITYEKEYGAFMVTAVFLLVWLPFYLITFLYTYKSEFSITKTFRNKLKDKEKVSEKSLKLVP